MKQRLIFLLTVSFVSLLLLSSCTDKAVNISNHERLYSIGLMLISTTIIRSEGAC